MKYLVEIILKNLTGYVPVLVSIIATPKRTILKLVTNETDKLNKALFFVGITIAIGFAFQAPLLYIGQDFLTVTGSMLAFKILAILAFSGVILMTFRLVRGKGNYETTLCAYLYLISPLYLLLVVLYVISIGIISTHDPDLALSWRSGQALSEEQIQELISAAPLMVISFTFLWLFQLLSPIIWFGICWGVFRKIHQVSLVRSTLAFLITIVIWFVFLVLNTLIMKGLYGGAIPSIL